MTNQTRNISEMKRINWMDNLRTIIISLVVVYHIGGVYESTGMWGHFWIVDDPDTLPWIGIVGILFDTFLMPTMFFISGYLTPSSYMSKKTSDFIRSKIKRLLLTWLIAVLILIPCYQVIFLYSRSLPQGEWFDYLFFNSPFSQSWLWYLPVLFVFNLVYLVAIKSGFRTKQLSLWWLAGFSVLASIGFSYLIGGLGGFRAWTNTPVLDFENERLLANFLFYLAGTIAYQRGLFSEPPKSKNLYLVVNSISWLPVTVHIILRLWPFLTNDFSVSPFYRLLWFVSLHLSSLSLVYLMVESFRRYINKTGRFIEMLNRNSFGVYIIHVVIIGILGALLLPVDLPATVKWLLLLVSTYLSSNLIVAAFRFFLKKGIGSLL